MKKNQKILYISIIVILSVVCAISIAYNFTGGFYFSRILKYDKILGEEQTISVNDSGAFVTSCNFNGTCLLNDDIKQVIYIQTTNLNQPLYLRAKMQVVGTNINNLMFGYTNWISKENDPYIYFNQPINSNEKIGLCKYVRFDESNKFVTNVNYILQFVVEASDVSFAGV